MRTPRLWPWIPACAGMNGCGPIRALVVAALIALAAPGLAQERLAIITTTSDLRSLTEAVGGDRVAVTSLVPPNLDPEEYQPRPQDLTRLKQARLVVRVGLDFDLWFDRLHCADRRRRRARRARLCRRIVRDRGA